MGIIPGETRLSIMGKRITPYFFLTLLLAAPLLGQGSFSVPLLNMQMEVLRLAPDETANQATFQLESADTVTLAITTTQPGVLLRVEAPGGQVVTPQNVESLGGQGFSADLTDAPGLMPFLPGHRTQLSFPSFGPGAYTVKVDGSNLTEETAVVVEASSDSTLGVSFVPLSSTHSSKAPIPLSVVVMDEGRPILGATVTAEVRTETGDPVMHELLDDGSEFDSQANDGLYSGLFVPQEAGKYFASAAVTAARANGESFTRRVHTSFESLPSYGFFTGTFTDRGVDDDGDGFFDSVEVSMDVDVKTPGDYRMRLNLKGPSGAELYATGVAEGLATGEQKGAASISLDRLREASDPGPYSVVEANLEYLVGEYDWQDAHLLINLGETAAYPMDSLKPSPITFVGSTDMGVDDDGDGTFDRLEVTLDVEVTEKDSYVARAMLKSSDGRRIEVASEREYLQVGRGQIKLNFFGPMLREAGIEGPYQIADLRLDSGSELLASVAPFSTKPYRLTEFDQFTPRITDVDPPELPAGNTVEVLIDVEETEFVEYGGVEVREFDRAPRRLEPKPVAVDFGPDIVVSNVEILTPDRVKATIAIGDGAATGPRAVTVRNGDETVTKAEVFWVLGYLHPESLVSVTPSSAKQGETVTLTIEGKDTNFQSDVVVNVGPIESSDFEVIDDDTLKVTMTFPLVMDYGTGDLVINYDYNGEGRTATLEDGFTIEAVPQLWSVWPNEAAPTDSATITLIGQATDFKAGVTAVDFGPGVTVQKVNVIQEDTIEVDIVVDASAAPGPRTITATTGAQSVSQGDRFAVKTP